MAHRRKMNEEKKVTMSVDIERAIQIGDDLQEFFKEKQIEPIEALISMMFLSECLKRYLKLLPEDYNRLSEAISKVK